MKEVEKKERKTGNINFGTSLSNLCCTKEEVELNTLLEIKNNFRSAAQKLLVVARLSKSQWHIIRGGLQYNEIVLLLWWETLRREWLVQENIEIDDLYDFLLKGNRSIWSVNEESSFYSISLRNIQLLILFLLVKFYSPFLENDVENEEKINYLFVLKCIFWVDGATMCGKEKGLMFRTKIIDIQILANNSETLPLPDLTPFIAVMWPLEFRNKGETIISITEIEEKVFPQIANMKIEYFDNYSIEISFVGFTSDQL